MSCPRTQRSASARAQTRTAPSGGYDPRTIRPPPLPVAYKNWSSNQMKPLKAILHGSFFLATYIDTNVSLLIARKKKKNCDVPFMQHATLLVARQFNSKSILYFLQLCYPRCGFRLATCNSQRKFVEMSQSTSFAHGRL